MSSEVADSSRPNIFHLSFFIFGGPAVISAMGVNLLMMKDEMENVWALSSPRFSTQPQGVRLIIWDIDHHSQQSGRERLTLSIGH